MATTGTIKTGWGSYAKDYELIVDWTQIINQSANTSTIKAVIKLYAPYSLSLSARYNNTVNINGVSYPYDSPAIETNGGTTHTLATINSGAIAHNADGSKSISISANFRFNATLGGTYYGTQTASATVALETIPKGAIIVSAPNFTDEDNPTITYSNTLGNAVSSIKACISLDGSKADIAYRDISKTGTTYTFTLTDAERNVLRNATTTANSRTVKFFIETVAYGQTYRNSVSKTLTIANCMPIIAPTAVDTGTISKTLTGSTDKIIRYYNSMNCAVNATALKGATIKSYKISCGSKSITTASGYLSGVESGVITFSATDSRGNTTTQTITKTLVEYTKLTCNLYLGEMSATGAITVKISGNYFNGSFGAVANTLSVEYRYKTSGGSYGSWTTATATKSGNTYTATINLTGFDYQENYTFQARASDKIYSGSGEPMVLSAETKVKSIPVFDWGENDFNFNVPTYHKSHVVMGHGMGIFGTNTSGTLVRAIDVNTNDTLEIGWGNYINSKGYTDIYGNNLRLISKNNILINGRAYGANSVLWSGAWHMNNEQSATLSQAISTQPHGVILVFSCYDNTNAVPHEYGWNTFFVPKSIVNYNGGGGHCFIMGINAGFSQIAGKYLYIFDNRITGHSGNTSTGTNSGITFKNNNFVLRYVIGV